MPADVRHGARDGGGDHRRRAARRWSRSIEGAEDDVNAGLGEMDARGSARRLRRRHRGERHDALRAAALERAQTLGARTALVVLLRAPAAAQRDLRLCITVLVGPEVVTGSTRMKAGTATKLVLNTITTGAMIRLGKTYGNLMVDLRPGTTSSWTAASAS